MVNDPTENASTRPKYLSFIILYLYNIATN